MSEDKILNNSNEINEIVVSNPICGELSLKKVTDDKLEAKKKYNLDSREHLTSIE